MLEIFRRLSHERGFRVANAVSSRAQKGKFTAENIATEYHAHIIQMQTTNIVEYNSLGAEVAQRYLPGLHAEEGFVRADVAFILGVHDSSAQRWIEKWKQNDSK